MTLAAQTPGIVARDNDPRNNCGTHFDSSLLLVSKVASGLFWRLQSNVPHISEVDEISQ